MEKKEYIKPKINVIAIDAVGIMAGSGPETIKRVNLDWMTNWSRSLTKMDIFGENSQPRSLVE